MDLNIKECIDYMYSHELINENNYNNLMLALLDYHKTSDRLDNCKAKYFIGEEVYSEKLYFDEEDGEFIHDSSKANTICKITIDSIALKHDGSDSYYVYNYLYREDEIFPDLESLFDYLKSKYYKAFTDIVNGFKKEINILKGVDTNGK